MLKVTLLAIIGTLALLETANAKFSFGFCDQPTLQSNFDITQYLGTWYEIVRDAATSYEKGDDCVTPHYSLNPDGTLNIKNSGYKLASQKSDIAYLTGWFNGPAGHVGFFWWLTGNYKVISTDYTNYSLVYSCDQFFWFWKTEYVWVLSRSQTLAPSIL